MTWDLRVIPVYFNVFYGIPFTPKIELSLGAGLGVSISELKPKYHTSLDNNSYGSRKDTSFGFQFIGRVLYHTGTFGEIIFEARQNQSGFKYEGHPESQGDIGGLSIGMGYNYFLF